LQIMVQLLYFSISMVVADEGIILFLYVQNM